MVITKAGHSASKAVDILLSETTDTLLLNRPECNREHVNLITMAARPRLASGSIKD